YLGLDLFEACQCSNVGRCRHRQGITHRCPLDFLDSGDHEPDFTRTQDACFMASRREDTNAVDYMRFANCLGNDLVTLLERSLLDPNQRDHTQIVIKPGIDNERLQWCLGVAFGWWNKTHDLFQNLDDAKAGFG